jgi:tyrosyl-tRNA synthetase
MTACSLAASRGEARRLVQQGGVSVNGEKVADIDQKFSQELFSGEGVLIKKGKKVFHRAVLV